MRADGYHRAMHNPGTSARQRRTALVTGASSGIGYDLARLLARDGHDLVLVARGVQALEHLAEECRASCSVVAHVIPADLADSGASERVVDELRQRQIPIDILVNNAGFGVHGPFASTDLSAELNLLQVNIVSLLQLTKLLLPGMIQRGWGRVLNVASTAAFFPGPYLNLYYASKAFVLSHSVALSRELEGSGVTVTALCPGPTRTNFQVRAKMERARLFSLTMMESQPVAEAGYRGMLRGHRVVVPGVMNKLSVLLSRLTPRGLQAKITARLNT